MTTTLRKPRIPLSVPAQPDNSPDTKTPTTSDALRDDLNALEHIERTERDRRREAELLRLQELARFD